MKGIGEAVVVWSIGRYCYDIQMEKMKKITQKIN
jgi:hypothetical protein